MAKKAPASAFEKSLKAIKINKSDPHAEVMLLSCIDFRFFKLIAQAMDDAGFGGKYDHFILAGAALGATLDFGTDHLPAPTPPDCKCPPFLPRIHWQQVFIEHIQIALQLHNTIHTVIIIEHRECGAYKTFLEPAGYSSATVEKAAHKAQADKLEAIIKGYFPSLTVIKWLASLSPPGVGPLAIAPAASTAGLRIDKL